MTQKMIAGGALLVVVAAVITGAVMRSAGVLQLKQLNLIDSQSLRALPMKSLATIDTSHVANGLTPPTNKWFSGIALQKSPQAVYPTPLSFQTSETGFSVGLPSVEATSTDILGEAVADVAAQVSGATSYKVTRYDQLSVDLTYYAGTRVLGTVTITAGSPYVFFIAKSDTTLTLSAPGHVSSRSNQAVIDAGTKFVHISGFGGTSIATANGKLTAQLPKNAFTTFYELPANAADTLATRAGNRITGTTVGYTKQSQDYRTTLAYLTANGKPTVIATLPHQQNISAQLTGLNYASIYGAMRTIVSNKLTFTTPAVPIERGLNISKLSAQQKQLLVDNLRQDATSTQFTANDTYFGGKQLYRAAQLLQLAHQLGQTQIANQLQQELSAKFDTWFSDDDQSQQYFYYNPNIRGIVGVESSFGTDVFNDHHYHYGYFIYAASILAQYDHTFLQRDGSAVNLLVADIANYKQSQALPMRRNFDPYFGHSWASGGAPFADGNNQESSSEAINAWTGVALWAQHTHNSSLYTEADWMLSSEVAANKAYWTDFDTQSAPYDQGFSKSVIGMNWGGKRDYATWFSADPAAMLGIQLVPFNPSMASLAAQPRRIQQNATEALPDGNYNKQFGDYILMYQALDGAKNTLDIAKTISSQNIDSANSRTYLYAWLMVYGR